MAILVLNYYFDIIAIACVMLALTASVSLYMRRLSGHGITRKAWIMLLILMGVGANLAILAGESERARLIDGVAGFAPTYALELQKLGHAAITLDTPADDPAYLTMIEAEKHWVDINPIVNDIYTFRRVPDGKGAYIVDSETDYNRDGKYEGEREERTAIGEPVEDFNGGVVAALDGHAAFDDEITLDRWGTWVAATVPLYDADGHVEAALGVDFDAREWIRAILVRRLVVMAMTAIAVAILVWSGGMIAVARGEIERRKKSESDLRQSERRVRAIVDNEPEAVFVLSPDARILECNPSGRALLEIAESENLAELRFIDVVAEPERPAAVQWVADAFNGSPATLPLGITARRSGARFIQAHAVRLPGAAGQGDTVLLVARDLTAQRAAETERERLQTQLVVASRQAGMADIASGVLHNIGNVLNTVNMSNHVLTDKLRGSKVAGLKKAVALLDEHRADLGAFLTTDQRGKQVPDYLGKLAGLLEHDHEDILGELRRMGESLEHMKSIIHSQQNYAKAPAGINEPVRAAALFDDAVKLNIASCERHHVQIVTDFVDMPPIVTDRHKALQILINLLANAKEATKSAEVTARKITLRLTRGNLDGVDSAVFEVADNGVGIAPDTLAKLFAMGFTTRKGGHGFGLHSAANFAKELRGRLTAASDGPGLGATFRLELPAVAHEPRSA